MFELLHTRYRILQAIQLMQPIGRRALAETLKMTEREIRKETEILRKQLLLESDKSGMLCTEDGLAVIEKLQEMVYEWTGSSHLALTIQKRFGVKKVIVVPGNYDEDETVLTLLGKEAAKQFNESIRSEQIVAVTGGKTVASLAPFLHHDDSRQNITFDAARGSIGHELPMQANTLVATFATKMNAQYRTLLLPEHLSEQAYQAMLKEPMVVEMLDYYNRADV